MFKPSTEKHFVMGALLAIKEISGAIHETQTLKLVLIFLPLVFQQLSSENSEIIEASSHCVGILAKIGGGYSMEIVDVHVKVNLINTIKEFIGFSRLVTQYRERRVFCTSEHN